MSTWNDFQGTAKCLDDTDLPRLAPGSAPVRTNGMGSPTWKAADRTKMAAALSGSGSETRLGRLAYRGAVGGADSRDRLRTLRRAQVRWENDRGAKGVEGPTRQVKGRS